MCREIHDEDEIPFELKVQQAIIANELGLIIVVTTLLLGTMFPKM